MSSVTVKGFLFCCDDSIAGAAPLKHKNPESKRKVNFGLLKDINLAFEVFEVERSHNSGPLFALLRVVKCVPNNGCRSEDELEGKLQRTWSAHLVEGAQHAQRIRKRTRGLSKGRLAQVRINAPEIRVIKDVERFGPQL